MVNGKQLVDTLMVAVLDEDMLEKYPVVILDHGVEFPAKEVAVVTTAKGQKKIFIISGD